MAICWYCHWGWSKPVVDIYNRFAPVAGESAMHYGPAHIVWDDENFERVHVQWCLDHFDDFTRGESTPEQNAAVRDSLTALLALSDDVLAPMPEDYDDEHPDQFPPSVEMAHHERV